jgi:hypothetical protein
VVHGWAAVDLNQPWVQLRVNHEVIAKQLKGVSSTVDLVLSCLDSMHDDLFDPRIDACPYLGLLFFSFDWSLGRIFGHKGLLKVFFEFAHSPHTAFNIGMVKFG